MLISIIFICFIIVYFIVGIKSPGSNNSEVLLRAVLSFSLSLTALTEALGFFNLISFTSIVICWVLITIAGSYYLYQNKTALLNFIAELRSRIKHGRSGLSQYERLLLTAIAILFFLEFIQGIIYPPNTFDSLTYHLSRVVSWISHHSVAPYPTYIPRQLYQPPLAEYFILHFNLLNRGDYFAASVQFFFQLACFVSILAISRQLGLNRYYRLTAFVLAATIPQVVLQASSTQNDVVASFFVLAAFYFAIKSIKEPGFENYLFLGLSAGLGLFTKGTAYLFVAPILLVFGINVLITIFKTKQFIHFWYAVLLVALVPLLINARQYYRNYSYSDNLLGTDRHEAELYGVERMNPALFICNTAKAIDVNMQLMFVPRITLAANKVVHKIFKVTKIDINEPAITYPHMASVSGIPGDKSYLMGGFVATHEDYCSNFIVMVLIWISLFIIGWAAFKRNVNASTLILAITCILQVLFFCGYLKWQPWGTRLQTPAFLLSVTLIACAAALSKVFNSAVKILVPFVICYSFVLVLFNCIRPFIQNGRVFHGYLISGGGSIFYPRGIKLFYGDGAHSAYPEYTAINNDIRKSNYKNIGLILADEGRQYPLFIDCYTRELNPVHIMVPNYTKNNTGYNDNVDCIVSTSTHQQFIDYKAKRYYNQNMKNLTVWYYKPM